MNAPALAPPDWRTAHLRTQGGRLLVRWACADRGKFEAIKADFRWTFPRHCDAIWRRKERVWSLPLRERARLMEWLACWGLDLVEEGNTP